MNIITKRVDELTPVEYKACYLANYGSGGYMRGELSDFRRKDRLKTKRPAVVIMLWDGPSDTVKSLIGWALLTPTTLHGTVGVTRYVMSRSKYTAQFWVKQKYRRKGYAKTLILEAKKHDPNPHVFPHDEKSGELFSSYKVQVLSADKAHLKSKPKVA